jgi:peptide/nickel transport system permease protein
LNAKWLSAIILGIIVSLTIFAPVLSPIDPMTTDAAAESIPPAQTWTHPLGTDRFGRDVLSRALYGGQHTLLIAFGATTVAIIGGAALGLLSAINRQTDVVITILINAMLAIPGLLIAFVVVTLLGQGEFALALATGLAQISPFARVVRGAVMNLQSAVYVEAATALGATRWRILLRHILPNTAATLLAYGGAVFSYCILNSAALSFLGLGAAPGAPDWGVMLADGRAGFRTVWWVSLVPGLMITLTVWAVNRLSDELGTR